MKQALKKMIIAAIVSIVCVCPSAWAGTLPRTAKLLPPETVLLVDVGNFSQLKSQFEKIDPYKLYKDPAMAAFIDNLKTKCQEKTKETDSEIGGRTGGTAGACYECIESL